MQALYVLSTEGHSGKTLTCLVLMQRCRQRGYTPGYLKPVGTAPRRLDGEWLDDDAHLVYEQMGMDTTPAEMCPLLATPTTLARCLQGELPSSEQLVRDAYQRIAAKHDPLIVGGSGSALCQGALLGIDASRLAQLFDARVLLVHPARDLFCLDRILACASRFGERMLGVIFNAVPPPMLVPVADTLTPYLERCGVRVLGAIPYDPLLASVTAAELTAAIGGKLLAGDGERPISGVAVGAMEIESVLAAMHGRQATALVTPTERTDLQLVALAAGVQALVLTGRQQPAPAVMSGAQAQNVPVIASRQDVFDTVALLEQALARSRVRGAAQLEQASRLFGEHVAFEVIDDFLNLN